MNEIRNRKKDLIADLQTAQIESILAVCTKSVGFKYLRFLMATGRLHSSKEKRETFGVTNRVRRVHA